MNRLVIMLLAMATFASCSAPKYTYNFDYYDYNAGKRKAEAEVAVQPVPTVNEQPAEKMLTASTEETPLVLAPSKVASKRKTSIKAYDEMTRAEKKEFRKELKNDFKKYLKVVKKAENSDVVGQNSGRLDPDVKMAIIFGAVGVVLFILGGVSEVFTILGAIALLVGVYFLVKWLIRQ